MATKIIIFYLIFAIFLIMICVSVLIFIKKGIYYKYVDTSRHLRPFDYVQDFDGNWLIMDIDYIKIMVENPSDTDELKYKITILRLCKIVGYILMLSLIILTVIVKFFGIL
jgi:hypothetical protein